MSCRGLLTFHDDQALSARNSRRSLDSFIGAFHCLNRHAGTIPHHHRLTQVKTGNLPRDFPPVFNICMASGGIRVLGG